MFARLPARPAALLLAAALALPALAGPAFGQSVRDAGSKLRRSDRFAAPKAVVVEPVVVEPVVTDSVVMEPVAPVTVGIAHDDGSALSPSEVYRRTLRGVVLIYTSGEDGVGKGTGWVLDADRGLIVTNQHVVGNADAVSLVFPRMEGGRLRTDAAAYDLGEDGFSFTDDARDNLVPGGRRNRRIRGVVVHSDTARDLALIQTDSLPAGTQALPLADRQVWPGERVHTIAGWPKGSESLWIYGTGTVRQVSRRTLANGVKTTVMESDALINKGNSGGPVVDDAGEVVAVVEGFASDARGLSLFVGLDAVREYLAEAVPLTAPRTADDYLRVAQSHQASLRLDRAIASMNEAIRLEPGNAGYVAIRGLMFAVNGDRDTARFDLNEAVRMAPDDSRVQGAYGQYHVLTGDYDTAVRALTRAIRNEPGNAEFYALRGVARKELGDLDAADRDLTRALHFAPENVDALTRRGEVRRLSGEVKAAVADHEAAIRLAPHSAEPWDQIGLDFYADKQFDKAAIFHGEAIERNAEVALYHFHQGDALQETGDWQGGLDALKRAIDLNPTHAPSWHYAGLSLANLENDDAAEKAYRKAIELAPEDAAVRKSLAVLLRRTGREDAAREQYAAAARLNPAFGDPQQTAATDDAPTGQVTGRTAARPVAPARPAVARLTGMADLAGTWRASFDASGERIAVTSRLDASGRYHTRYDASDARGVRTWSNEETGQMYLDGGEVLIGSTETGYTRHTIRYTGATFTVSYDRDVIPAGEVTWTRAN